MKYRVAGLALTIALILSACAQQSAPPTTGTVTSGAGNIAEPEETSATATAPAMPKNKPPNISQLLGLAAVETIQLLGEPALKRRETAAQIWRYGGEDCQLYLFFYAPKKDAAYQIRHLEAVRTAPKQKNPSPATASETQTCLDGLWQREHAIPTS